MVKKKYFITFYLLGLLGSTLLLFAYTFYIRSASVEPVTVTEFPRIPIQNHLGQLKTIDEYRGKIILVDFWFSNCPPCLAEMKYFPELLTRYDNLVIMSFSIDAELHTKDLLKRKPEPWSFLLSDHPRWTFYNVARKEKNGYVDALHVTSFPTYFLLDEKGDILSSPRNAIYSVEKKLGSLSSLKLSYYRYFDELDFRTYLKGLILYHLLVLATVLLSATFVKRDN